MLPAARTDTAHDSALDTVLDRLTGGLPDRPDTPDAWVTAVRRLPAVEAAYAPFPEGIDSRLKAAFESRGVHQLYTHQAEAFEPLPGVGSPFRVVRGVLPLDTEMTPETASGLFVDRN